MLFFDALSIFGEATGKFIEKMTRLNIPFFGLASSMAQYESSQLKAQKEYSSQGSVNYETLDNMVTNGIDVIDGIVKLRIFLYSKRIFGNGWIFGFNGRCSSRI